MKPFSIQAPEEVAKQYGGNKQQIAQAAQLGIIDPTAAVLAGMFIDRMRGAQAQEAANPPTVAQDVMGGAPAQPAAQMPAPAPSSPGGLGATPQAAPPMAPAMPPQGGAPMGMAAGGMVPPYASGGGLSDVPVPDDMYDEPSNGGFGDGYSGGGLVAFAQGGVSDLFDDVEMMESGGRQSAVSPKGARGVMQLMPGTMRDPGFGIAPMRDNSEAENRRVGQQYLNAMFRKYGDRATALMAYNWGPGNVDKWVKAGKPADAVPAETRKYVASILGGKAAAAPARGEDKGSRTQDVFASADDIYGDLRKRFGQTPEEKSAREAMYARAKEMASPEAYDKQRKADMWQTLAEIGFNMASSKSPYLLQAVGEAAAAAMPGARADKKERKALKDRGLDLMVELGAADRKEAQRLWGMAVDTAKVNLQQQQSEREFGLKERELEQEATLTREGRTSAENVARIGATSRDTTFDIAYQNNYNKLKAEADAGTWKTPMGGKPSDEIIKYWAQKHALEDINKYKGTGSGNLTPEQIKAMQEGRTGGEKTTGGITYLGPE